MNEEGISLPGWSFSVDEISAGVYRIHGVDTDGRTITRDGTDPESLRSLAEADAVRMTPNLLATPVGFQTYGPIILERLTDYGFERKPEEEEIQSTFATGFVDCFVGGVEVDLIR